MHNAERVKNIFFTGTWNTFSKIVVFIRQCGTASVYLLATTAMSREDSCLSVVAYRIGGGVDETDLSVLKDWGLTLALCQCEILGRGAGWWWLMLLCACQLARWMLAATQV